MDWAPIWLWTVVYLDGDGVFALVHEFAKCLEVVFTNRGHKTLMYFCGLFPVLLPYWWFVDGVAFPLLSLLSDYSIIYGDEIIIMWDISCFSWSFNKLYHSLLLSGVNNPGVVPINDEIFPIFNWVFFKLLLKIILMNLFHHFAFIEFYDCDVRMIREDVWYFVELFPGFYEWMGLVGRWLDGEEWCLGVGLPIDNFHFLFKFTYP